MSCNTYLGTLGVCTRSRTSPSYSNFIYIGFVGRVHKVINALRRTCTVSSNGLNRLTSIAHSHGRVSFSFGHSFKLILLQASIRRFQTTDLQTHAEECNMFIMAGTDVSLALGLSAFTKCIGVWTFHLLSSFLPQPQLPLGGKGLSLLMLYAWRERPSIVRW